MSLALDALLGLGLGLAVAEAGGRAAADLRIAPQWALAPLVAGAVAAVGFELWSWWSLALVAAGARGLIVAARAGAAPSATAASDDYPLGTAAAGPVRVTFGVGSGRHMLQLGATGSGKTNTLVWIAARHVERGFGCVVIDLKGDPALARRLQLEALAHGRPFWNFTLEGGDHWNPLAHGNPTELKDKLIGLEHFSEKHYQRMYERYMLAVFRVLAQLERRATLSELITLLHPRRLRDLVKEVADDDFAHGLNGYLEEASEFATRHLSGLRDRLALLIEGEQGPYLLPAERPLATIDLLEIARGGGVAVFTLAASSYPETARLVANMLLQELSSICGALERGPTPRPGLLVALDEFSALDADHFAALFARARSAGVSLLCATQELADLRRVRSGFDEQLIGNVDAVLAGRQNNPDSAELVSRLAGSEEAWVHTLETRRRLGRAPRATGFGNARLERRPVLSPDTVSRLSVGEAVLIAKNPHRVELLRTVPLPPMREPTGSWEWAEASNQRARLGMSRRDGIPAPAVPDR